MSMKYERVLPLQYTGNHLYSERNEFLLRSGIYYFISFEKDFVVIALKKSFQKKKA